MDIDIVTKDDLRRSLQEIRLQIVADVQDILKNAGQRKEWLKNDEVKKLLKISTGTLQNLRVSGKLHPSKIGGILYYSVTEIEGLLNKQ